MAAKHPAFVIINKLHAVKLDGRKEVIQMTFIVETFTLSTHPRRELGQPAFIIH